MPRVFNNIATLCVSSVFHPFVTSRISLQLVVFFSVLRLTPQGLYTHSLVCGPSLKETWMQVSETTSLFSSFFFDTLPHKFQPPQHPELYWLHTMRPLLPFGIYFLVLLFTKCALAGTRLKTELASRVSFAWGSLVLFVVNLYMHWVKLLAHIRCLVRCF